jgi:hypothetical protein
VVLFIHVLSYFFFPRRFHSLKSDIEQSWRSSPLIPTKTSRVLSV